MMPNFPFTTYKSSAPAVHDCLTGVRDRYSVDLAPGFPNVFYHDTVDTPLAMEVAMEG